MQAPRDGDPGRRQPERLWGRGLGSNVQGLLGARLGCWLPCWLWRDHAGSVMEMCIFSWQVSWHQLDLRCWQPGKGKYRVHLLLTGYLSAACEKCSLLRRAPCLAGHPGCHPSRPFRGISFLAVLIDCCLGKSRPLLHVFRNADALAKPGEQSVCVCLGQYTKRASLAFCGAWWDGGLTGPETGRTLYA